MSVTPSTGLPINVMMQKASSVTRGQLNLKLCMIPSGCNIRNQFKTYGSTCMSTARDWEYDIKFTKRFYPVISNFNKFMLNNRL